MGNALSSFTSQHPVYVIVPLACLATTGYTLCKSQSWDPLEPSTPATLLHLASLCLSLGSHTWHHAFTGPCLAEGLPAETSSSIECSLLQRLSMLTTVSSTLCLATSLLRHPYWELADGIDTYQIYFLVTGVLSGASNTLLFIPWASQLQTSLNKVEGNSTQYLPKREAVCQGSETDFLPKVQTLLNINHRQFRIVTLVATLTGHLGYIANFAYLGCLAFSMKEL